MKNEIVVSFCIWGFDDIAPDKITELLDVKPSKVLIKGQKKGAIGSALVTENGWILHSAYDRYSCFEDQLNSLLDVLESRLDVLKLLSDEYYTEFSCALYLYFDNGESIPSIHLNERYNRIVKDLKIEFDFDIYCLPNTAGQG